MTEIDEVTKVKTCESCGEEFGCGAEASTCWCSEIVVSPSVLETMGESFEECLCPNCLVRESKRSETNAN